MTSRAVRRHARELVYIRCVKLVLVVYGQTWMKHGSEGFCEL